MTRHPLITGALGALIIAFSAPLVKLAAVTPATAAFFRCAYALPALGLLAAHERKRFGPRPIGQRRLAWIAGILLALDLIFWHHAIKEVGAGLATVLGNIQVVFVALLAWVILKEHPGGRALVAVPLSLIGVVLISGALGAGAYGSNPAMGVVFGALTGLSYSVFLLILRSSNKDIRRPVGPLFDATLASAVVVAVIGAVIGDLDVGLSWPAHGWLVTLALSSQVAGWVLISMSLPRLPAAVTSVVLTLQPVGSVALGIIMFNEDPSVTQLIGVALILSGLAAMTLRRKSPKEVYAPSSGG